MLPIQHFRRLMKQRREWPRGSAEWRWRTNAARKYLMMHKNIPAKDWNK